MPRMGLVSTLQICLRGERSLLTPRHMTMHKYEAQSCIHPQHAQILDRRPGGTHVTGHLLARQDTARVLIGPERKVGAGKNDNGVESTEGAG